MRLREEDLVIQRGPETLDEGEDERGRTLLGTCNIEVFVTPVKSCDCN